MPPTIVGTEAPVAEISLEDLRSAYKGARAPEVEAPETEEAPEVKPQVKADPAETGEQEPEEAEIELPAGVKKRIAIETARQARAQSAIDHAVSARLAKEDELAKLTGKPGSEPAKTTETAKQGRPTRPMKPELATFTGTLDQLSAAETKYEADLAKYETDLETWFHAETEKTFEQRYSVKQQEASKRTWMEQSTAKHGAEFPDLVASMETTLPEALQVAVSALPDPAAMVVHLGKNADDLKGLLDAFKANPYLGIIELGELKLKLSPPEPKQAASIKKPLPKPLAPVGGGASASAPVVDLEKVDDKTFMSEIGKMVKSAKK